MQEQEAAARRVADRLAKAGHQALFAGGCVRDRLRGAPPKDFDIATSARPPVVRSLFPQTVAVGESFGVVVVVDGGVSVEVATFREDIGTKDARHPESVRFADARADALRRDFTVNGLFEVPETGEVLDFVGGRRDLEARVIRTIGDPRARFSEDRLRLLRAVRFAVVLDFVIEPGTARALRRDGPTVVSVSAERIRDELTRILASGRGGRGLGLLHEFGILQAVLPEVAALHGVPQPPSFHPEGDVFTHTRMLLDDCPPDEPVLALAALFHDVGKAPTALWDEEKSRMTFPAHAARGAEIAADVMRRLRYSNREIDQVQELVARHMDWPNVPRMRDAKRRRFLLRDDFRLHLELHRLDCAASHGDLSLYAACGEERARLEAEPPPLRPLLDGDALIAMGFVPGPAFSRILGDLVDAQLEGRVADAAQARDYVSLRYRPPFGEPVAGDPP